MAERSDHNHHPLASALAIDPEEPQSPSTDADADADSPESPSSERDAREATELARLRRNYSRASSYPPQGSSTASSRQPTTSLGRFRYAIAKFWKHQVSITVPHDSCRDHLALERTFLGYLRTSLALSMIGVLVSQLFRLQHVPTPDPHFGFYVLGKPLSCICQGAALYTMAIGTYRTWRTQNAIVRGKALTGGFDIILLAIGVFLILIMFFVLLIAVDIRKEHVN